MNNPWTFDMADTVRNATRIINDLENPEKFIKDGTLARKLMTNAEGLAFLTVAKLGFLLGVRAGTGLVVARDRTTGRWSPPSAISTASITGGAFAGASVVDYIFILTNKDAVRKFAVDGMASFGVSADLTLGIGRSAEAAVTTDFKAGLAPVYTYSSSKGIYGGLSASLGGIKCRNDVNRKVYGRAIPPEHLLLEQGSGFSSGYSVSPPRICAPLYQALNAYYTRNGISRQRGGGGGGGAALAPPPPPRRQNYQTNDGYWDL